MHDNNALTKIEKFNYFKSYFGGSATNAIKVFQNSESNYDSALKILKDRSGQKDVITSSHMDKLLILNPVCPTIFLDWNEIESL